MKDWQSQLFLHFKNKGFKSLAEEISKIVTDVNQKQYVNKDI